MPNQHYSIFIAQDNLNEVICGFSSLYFRVVTDKLTICDHYFSVAHTAQKAAKNRLTEKAIILEKKSVEKIIEKALMLQNKQLTEGEDIVIPLGKNASFTAIFSVSY